MQCRLRLGAIPTGLDSRAGPAGLARRAFPFASRSRDAQRARMLRRLFVVVLVGLLASCAKPALPDVVVRAATSSELASFRADLGTRFAADQLEPFDIALQELQLDAMHREITPPAAREADMLAAINGKTIRAAQLLGWMARRARLLRETALFSTMLKRDLKTMDEAPATGPSQTFSNRIQNAQDILARLQHDLADTDRRLADWGAGPAKP